MKITTLTKNIPKNDGDEISRNDNNKNGDPNILQNKILENQSFNRSLKRPLSADDSNNSSNATKTWVTSDEKLSEKIVHIEKIMEMTLQLHRKIQDTIKRQHDT